ncbi:hypothetical protein KC360_g37 [Hortaea werneckii]|nr:hypothetical protein KC360_g37 [Hortaea werneckii]
MFDRNRDSVSPNFEADLCSKPSISGKACSSSIACNRSGFEASVACAMSSSTFCQLLESELFQNQIEEVNE